MNAEKHKKKTRWNYKTVINQRNNQTNISLLFRFRYFLKEPSSSTHHQQCHDENEEQRMMNRKTKKRS